MKGRRDSEVKEEGDILMAKSQTRRYRLAKRAAIVAQKCNFPIFGNYDRLTNRPTNQPTDGQEGSQVSYITNKISVLGIVHFLHFSVKIKKNFVFSAENGKHSNISQVSTISRRYWQSIISSLWVSDRADEDDEKLSGTSNPI